VSWILCGTFGSWEISFNLLESILPNFFSPFFFFRVKLGHFTLPAKNGKISKEKKFGMIDSWVEKHCSKIQKNASSPQRVSSRVYCKLSAF